MTHHPPSEETLEPLLEVKKEILRFGRYLLTFVALPVFLFNSVPVWLRGEATPFLWVQAIVFPGALPLVWSTRRWPFRFQALLMAFPVALLSVASVGQWGLTFGAGILQMAVLSLLVVFFFSSIRTVVYFALAMILLDLALGLAILNGWLPTPDVAHVDAANPDNWSRIFVTTAAAIPVTLFILGRALQEMVKAVQESRERLVSLKAEQAAREEAQKAFNRAQRMEVVGRLASGLSHDFNNALTLIRGSAELLQMGSTPEEQEELLEGILRASDNAADLSRRLLIFSRQGEATETQAVDLGGSLQKLGKSLRRLLPPNIEVNIRSRARSAVQADPSQLDQAILNLCLNARDAMPDGGWLELSGEDRVMADGSPGVVVQVKDSGVGMDANTLKMATEPFFTTKEEGKGTGLGLAMVRKMVDQHGGVLEIDSSPGLGSVFSLHLPACTGGDVVSTTVTPQPRHGGSILVVDDDPGVRRIVGKILEEHGFRVVSLSSAGEAVALLEAHYAFDVLVTDGVPQRDNSRPLTDHFMDHCPRGRVLVYSGRPPEALEEQGIRSEGRVSVAQKPLPANALLERVSDLVSQTKEGEAQ